MTDYYGYKFARLLNKHEHDCSMQTTFAYNSIQKTMEKYGIVNESQDSRTLHTSSESNS